MSTQDREWRETRRQKIKQQKRRRLVALALAVVILVLLIIGIVKLIGWIGKPRHGESANTGPTPQASDVPINVEAPPKFFDYSVQVPETNPVDDSYFSKVLFLGDVRVSGFSVYNVVSNADVLAGEVSVDEASSYKFDFKGNEITLVDQLASKQYDAIYLMFGFKEQPLMKPETYRVQYAELINTIRTLAPNTAIYLQSSIPMSTSFSGTRGYSNEQAAAYTRVTASLATEKQVYYVDVGEALSTSSVAATAPPTATLPPSASDPAMPPENEDNPETIVGGYPALASQYVENNGYSLNKSGYTVWIEYLKTHVVDRSLYAN